jgi:hypothetical protein
VWPGWFAHIHFEFIVPGTPQQNGKVERKFATLYFLVRSNPNHAKVTKKIRKIMWVKAAHGLTIVYNSTIQQDKAAPPYKLFFGVDPKCVRALRTFSEVGGVMDHARQKLGGKLEDCSCV